MLKKKKNQISGIAEEVFWNKECLLLLEMRILGGVQNPYFIYNHFLGGAYLNVIESHPWLL